MAFGQVPRQSNIDQTCFVFNYAAQYCLLLVAGITRFLLSQPQQNVCQQLDLLTEYEVDTFFIVVLLNSGSCPGGTQLADRAMQQKQKAIVSTGLAKTLLNHWKLPLIDSARMSDDVHTKGPPSSHKIHGTQPTLRPPVGSVMCASIKMNYLPRSVR